MQRNNEIFMNIGFLSATTREEAVPSEKHMDEENLSENFFIHPVVTHTDVGVKLM